MEDHHLDTEAEPFQSAANLLETERTTHDLQQLIEQSALAAREAQSATRSKSDFLARMSHEIRTPLNGILGMTAALLSRELAPADRDCVETIRSSGEALLAVVDSVLDISKIEAGRMDLECADFQPAQVVTQALQIIRGAALSKSLMLETDIDPSCRG
jgi:signal transduction histidine kinase